MTPVVIGLGQAMGQDDAVGLHVARALARQGFEASEHADASSVLPWLEQGRRVILVDAVVTPERVGTVLSLRASDLRADVVPLSSHGLGVAEMLGLADALYEGASRRVHIVGIVIEAPTRVAEGLSADVQAAVERACDTVRTLLMEDRS